MSCSRSAGSKQTMASVRQRTVLRRAERHARRRRRATSGRPASSRGRRWRWRSGRRPCGRAGHDSRASVGHRAHLLERVDGAEVGRAGSSTRTAGCEWCGSPHRVVANASLRATPRVRRAWSSPGSARITRAGEQRCRTALVDDDVRRLVAQHRPPRRAQRGEPEAVGGGAGHDREHGHVVVLEHLGAPGSCSRAVHGSSP